MKHIFTLLRSLLLIGLLFGKFRLETVPAQAPTWQTANAVATASNAAYTVTTTDPTPPGPTSTWPAILRAPWPWAAGATSAGGNDVFVGKWNVANQRFTWAQRAGGTNNDLALSLKVSGPNVYMSGVFVTAATFGSVSVTSAGASDGFVAKLVDGGATAAFAWVLPVGGANEDRATALAVNGSNVYLSRHLSQRHGYAGPAHAHQSQRGRGGRRGACVPYQAHRRGHERQLCVGAQLWRSGGRRSATDLAVSGAAVYLAGDFTGNLNLGSHHPQQPAGAMCMCSSLWTWATMPAWPGPKRRAAPAPTAPRPWL